MLCGALLPPNDPLSNEVSRVRLYLGSEFGTRPPEHRNRGMLSAPLVDPVRSRQGEVEDEGLDPVALHRDHAARLDGAEAQFVEEGDSCLRLGTDFVAIDCGLAIGRRKSELHVRVAVCFVEPPGSDDDTRLPHRHCQRGANAPDTTESGSGFRASKRVGWATEANWLQSPQGTIFYAEFYAETVAIAAPVRLSGYRLARRFISRNSASAASPRRWCSAGVRSGTSLPRFRMVTMADFAGGGASTFPGAGLRRVTTAGTSSATGFFFLGGRL